MSTHLPGFQSFLRFSASFCICQISQQQREGLKVMMIMTKKILIKMITQE